MYQTLIMLKPSENISQEEMTTLLSEVISSGGERVIQ